MIGLRVYSDDLAGLTRALRSAEDGKKLRRDLAKEIRKALSPAVAEAKAGVMSMDSAGSGGGEPLRPAIAAQVKAQARLSGRSAGAKVRVRKRGMPRGFDNAPRRTNRAKGWRHPVFGDRDTWVHQVGKPDWFDDPMRRGAPRYRAAVVRAMADTARRITRRA